MGLLCVVLDWFLYNQERTREFGIRRRYGALPTTLVRENLLFGIAGLLIGSAIGGIMSKLLIAEVSHTDIPLFNLQTFASIAISFIIVILTWSLILYVVIKTNKEVNVDA
jgi:di/tricarboxylate transporter